MRTNSSSIKNQSGRPALTGTPVLSKRIEWFLTTAVIWLLLGVFLDGWAHNNIPDLIDTFFTPWHAVLYSGFGATALVLGITYLRQVKAGYLWRRGLPKPYIWSLIGVLIFSIAGNLDLIWHELFGFEEDVEALLSPTHLSLALGGVLIASTILRAKWNAVEIRGYGRWRSFLPAFLSFFSVLAIITFFAQFANVFTHPQLFAGTPPVGDSFFQDVTLISAVLLPAALLMGFTLALLRRWTVPFGTLTITVFGIALLMFLLNWDQSRPYSLILLAPLVSGLAADIFLRQWQRSATSLVWWRVFSFIFPFTLNAIIFAIFINFYGIWWQIHMWLGVTFLSGLVGLGLSLLLLPPVFSAQSFWYAQLLEEQTRD